MKLESRFIPRVLRYYVVGTDDDGLQPLFTPFFSGRGFLKVVPTNDSSRRKSQFPTISHLSCTRNGIKVFGIHEKSGRIIVHVCCVKEGGEA